MSTLAYAIKVVTCIWQQFTGVSSSAFF